MKYYSDDQKAMMREFRKRGSTMREIAKRYGCALSTVYYALNPEAYERHKEYVYYKWKRSKQ